MSVTVYVTKAVVSIITFDWAGLTDLLSVKGHCSLRIAYTGSCLLKKEQLLFLHESAGMIHSRGRSFLVLVWPSRSISSTVRVWNLKLPRLSENADSVTIQSVLCLYIKSKKYEWAGHVARVAVMRNANSTFFFGKLEIKEHFVNSPNCMYMYIYIYSPYFF